MNSHPGGQPTERTASIDLDQFSKEQQRKLLQELVKHNGFPLFEGTVEHLYTKVAVSKTRTCPRCKAATERKTAHFIYVTEVGTRVMTAPAGYFCTRCPTVVVDEQVLKPGVKPGLTYRGVVGIAVDGKEDPCLFKSLNGKRAVYFLDEDEKILGLGAAPPEPPQPPATPV